MSLHFFYGQSTSNCNCGHDLHMVLNALNPNEDLIDLRKSSPYLACSMYNIDFNTFADSTAWKYMGKEIFESEKKIMHYIYFAMAT